MEWTFTELLSRGRGGDRPALEVAYSLIFSQLKRIAGGLLSRERQTHTMQATELVSELYVRLNRLQCQVLSREHFLSLAAKSMKQHLIDRSRRREVRRRCFTELTGTTLASPVFGPDTSEHAIALRLLLEQLDRLDPRAAIVVRLIKIEGMTAHEAATHLNLPVWKVVDDCEYALEWIQGKLK